MGEDDNWAWQSAAGWTESPDVAISFDGRRYREPRPLAQGGMGRVETVLDAHLGRRVARKTLRVELSSDDAAVARLGREAQVTARLEHPNIVPVYNAGQTSDGRLFYTMRFVQGRSMAGILAEATSLEERLDLVSNLLAVCNAVAYAHSRGVVHRDLKPDNILMGAFGETLVADWGVARVLGEAEESMVAISGGVGLTRVGAVIGTPAYMAPEQAAGDEVGPQADVFALGRTLHQILAGTLDAPCTEPPELVAVVHKATRIDPHQRYPDASGMARDLDDWLAGRRVGAFAYSTRDLARRLIRQWRAPITVGVLALAALGASGVGFSVRTAAERDRAVDAELSQRQVTASALVQTGWQALKTDDYAQVRELATQALRLVDHPEARSLLAATDLGALPSRLHTAALPECTGDLVLGFDGADALCVNTNAGWRASLDPVVSVRSLPASCDTATVIGDLTACRDGVWITFFDRLGAVQGLPFPAPIPGALLRGPDDTLAVVSHGHATLVRPNWHGARLTLSEHGQFRGFSPQDNTRGILLSTGSRVAYREDSPRPVLLHEHFVPDGVERYVWLQAGGVVAGLIDGSVVRVDETGGLVWRTPSPIGAIETLELSPDRSRAAVVSARSELRVIRVDSGAVVANLTAPVTQAVWMNDDTLRVVRDDEVQTWHVPQQLSPVVFRHDEGQGAVAVNPDGQRVAVAGGGNDLRVVSLGTGAAHGLDLPYAATGATKFLSWAPDASALYAGIIGPAPNVTRWTGPDLTFDPVVVEPRRQARDGVAVPGGGLIQLFYVDGFSWFRAPDVFIDALRRGVDYRRLVADPSHALVLMLDAQGTVHRWDASTTEFHALWSQEALGAMALASPEGPLVAISRADVLVLDPLTGHEHRRWSVSSDMTAIAVDPHARWVAVGLVDGTVHVYALASGERLGRFDLHTARISAMDVLPDGTGFVTTSWDGDTRRLSVAPLLDPYERVLADLE